MTVATLVGTLEPFEEHDFEAALAALMELSSERCPTCGNAGNVTCRRMFVRTQWPATSATLECIDCGAVAISIADAGG